MSSMAAEVGLIHTMRSGNVVVDTMLCMIVPLLIQRIIAHLNANAGSIDIVAWIRRLLFGAKTPRIVMRTIELKQRFNQWGRCWDGEQKNHLLQKAIANYLADELELRNKNGRYELLEKPASLCLRKVRADAECNAEGDDGASETSEASTATVDCSASESEDDFFAKKDGRQSQVEKLNVGALPPLNQWVEVEDGVFFNHRLDQGDDDEDQNGDERNKDELKETTVRYMFRSELPDGSARIDALIDRAFERYRDLERKRRASDKARYMYIQAGSVVKSSSDDDKDGNKKPAPYKRYALGEEKTFDNLFFDGKEQVLQLLDNFTNRSGKFAIKGFPYKLGLLLHGPPGTGKTSLIKAVAQHTKRHIVTISLANVKTNQELMNLMFDLKFSVDGLDLPVRMGFDDVVFVMEDIDCASSVVMSRKETGNKKGVLREDMAEEELLSLLLGSSSVGDGPEAFGPLTKKESASSWWSANDKLNLAGLLNVLDGVVDTPGRIVIMTTNHPEKLDPALIRPGRVNKKLLLDYMNPGQVQRMIEYYFATELTKDQVTVIATSMAAADDATASERVNAWTPAQIEELCAEYEEVDEALAQLSRPREAPEATAA